MADLTEAFEAEKDVAARDVVSVFSEIVAAHGDLTALEIGSRRISYETLDRLSDHLAARLAELGVNAGDYVGVAAERRPEAVISLLAIIKIGAAYAPLPAYYPAERLEMIAKDAGLGVLIGDVPGLSGDYSRLSFASVLAPPDISAGLATLNPEIASDAPAYAMFTSGSTGAPKGVVVPHQAIIRLVRGQNFMELGPDERILQYSPIAFDAATLEIWGALLNGGVLVFPEGDLSLRELGRLIAEKSITSMWLTAGLFHAISDERPGDFAPLRQLLTGGDVVSPVKVARVMKACPELTVINGYGPTENTTFTCCHKISREEAESGKPLPIGAPISGTQVYVLNEDLQPVADGEAGELCASGLGLSLGYLNRPDVTAEAFTPAPWNPELTLYRTGDQVRRAGAGPIQYLGRIDTQVKIRGFRVELGEIETALEQFPDVRQAAVVARPSADGADKLLVGYFVADDEIDLGALTAQLFDKLPNYAVPAHLIPLDALPLGDTGKVDRRALSEREPPVLAASEVEAEASALEAAEAVVETRDLGDMVAAIVSEVLELPSVDRAKNFFDLGASSLHIARIHEKLMAALDREFPVTDFFRHSTVSALAEHLGAAEAKAETTTAVAKRAPGDIADDRIAVVGVAGRFPGAPDVESFWNGLMEGREMISHFSEDELDVTPEGDASSYVRARGMMSDADMFDARHFGIPPREAERLDPQHRILLEVAQSALENANCDPDRFAGRIGVFAGASQNSYLLNNLLSGPGATRRFAAGYPVKDFATLFGNDKDFMVTRIAYRLNLRGPAVNVQCACSTSLVAVAQACQALLNGDADMALAGGVSVTFPSKRAYLYTPEGMASADGHCRTFDSEATGTVFGDGAGMVALRRLENALADGDDVLAVIRGYAINNDGSEKAGYAAPSIAAQAQVIKAAHVAAGVSPREIGYVEAHGTGTPLGDPIEFAALSEAFGAEERGYCALGTAKTNIGHLDIAAGVTGLIKTVLTLKHGVIPPMLHYTKPNPRIDFDSSAFYPAREKTEWRGKKSPRIAGVSAFGVGGTNIHMVLEQPPAPKAAVSRAPDAARVFPISASCDDALAAAIANLGAWAADNAQADPADVAATLRGHRREYARRAVLVADDMAGLAKAAKEFAGESVTASSPARLVMMFPGQGAQHVGMGRELFAAEPVFREALSLCAALLEPELGLNLLDIIHAPAERRDAMTEKLRDTAIAQPAIFSMSYALAKQWADWGVEPDAMIGHSIGELVAATIAGMFELQDALKLVALRGRLMSRLPRGAMISVRASIEEIDPFLKEGLDLAAENGAKACVIAGPDDAADVLLPKLEAAGLAASRLHTSHAFHSHMMDPIVPMFREALANLNLTAPRRPIFSTVTGDWLTEIEATDPSYWADHLRRSVRFYEAVRHFWAEGDVLFLESGPGQTLATLASQNPNRDQKTISIGSMPHAQAQGDNDHYAMLSAFGGLWAHGRDVDWSRIDPAAGPRARLRLPNYPFQRQRFWVEPVDARLIASGGDAAGIAENARLSDTVAEDPPPVSAIDAVREMLSDLSGVDPKEIVAGVKFLELGFDSLLLTQATKEIGDRFGVTVALRQLIDTLSTPGALADYIEANGDLSGAAPADRTGLAEMTRIEGEGDNEAVAEMVPSSAPTTKIDAKDAPETLAPEQRAHIDQLVARYTAKTRRSKELTTKHREAHADPRTASGFNRLWKELVYQIVSDRSKGSRIVDVDGNEYIDILNGFGPGFLGHGPENVIEAVEKQLHAGFEVGPQHIAAMEAAELFARVTGNDRASFVCTGSEAVYAAMRLARTVTRRDTVVMFARDYHGNFDEVLVRGVDGASGPRTMPLAPGIPRDSVKNVVVLPYGTPQALDYIRKNAGQLAAVIVEPVQSRRPEFRPADFIREVRRITRNSGGLLIFDEVVTGFRFGPRGAQAYYGVDADLVTYGKVVGGGMPLGVVSGKARYMDTFDGGQWSYGDDSFPEAPVTFFAGTFVRHPLAMASLRAMLEFFDRQPPLFWKTVNAKGDKLAGAIDRWFTENDMPFQMPNCGSLMYLRIAEDQKFGPLLGAHLRDRGVFLLEGFPSYVTAAHDDEDLDHVIEAMKDSALEMRAAGMLSGRERIAYNGPKVSTPPARLTLPNGESAITKAMSAPVETFTMPTTEAQREIWAAIVVTPEVAAAYNESVTLKLEGQIDRAALIEATKQCFERHDALRSRFSADGAEMIIRARGDVAVDLIDLTNLDETARQERLAEILKADIETPFDMPGGEVLRAHLAALAEDRHHLIITAHHIVCDGWSIDVVMRDIGAIYTALRENRPVDLTPPLSIIDYARAEAEWSRTEAAKEAEEYWLEQFRELPPVLDLPTDHPRPNVRTVRGDRIDWTIPDELSEKLRKLARSQGATFVNMMLAVYKLYVARLTGLSDIVIALPTSGQASRGLDTVVGHCVNLLPIRSTIDWDASFSDYLGVVRNRMLDAFDHQNYTFGSLVRALKIPRDYSRVPLAPVIFNIDNGIDLSTMSFGDVETEFVTNPRAFENFELYLNVTDNKDNVTTEWSFNAQLFERPTIEGHIARFEKLLDGLANDPSIVLRDVGKLMAGDYAPASGAHDDPGAAGPQTITEVFDAVVAKAPQATALRYGDETLDYATLNQRANGVAQMLRAEGVAPGDLVGISSARSLNLIVAVLGALKAGVGYVPFDVGLPADRARFMAEDTGVKVFFGSNAALSDLDVKFVPFDALPEPADAAPDVEITGMSMSYVMFTSGTTGVPKAVVQSHQCVIRMLVDTDWVRLGPDTVTLHSSAFAFDTSIIDIFGALLHGGTVVIPPDGQLSIADLAEAIGSHGVNTLWLTSGLFHAIAELRPEVFAEVGQLIVGGDVVSPQHVASVMCACPNVQVINGFGPTESNVCNAHPITWDDVRSGQALPIGQAIPGAQIYILDDAMTPTPTGVQGELCIAGRGVALGYWNRPELTAEKFVTAPWDPGLRLYRSGDLASNPGNGELRFFGRIDTQVKVRGFRVELSEVEVALDAHPNVAQCVVVAAAPEGQTDKVLAAYFVSVGDSPSRRALAEHMKGRLPEFARPTHYIEIDELPLNQNGKVDRRALPPIVAQSTDGRINAPQNPAEETLADIWRDLLGLESAVDVEANFFELGGHSLLAVRLFDRVRAEFGVDMPISTLFQNPTIRDLANAIASDPRSQGKGASGAELKVDEDAEWDTSAMINPGPGTGERALFIVGGVGGNLNNLIEFSSLLGQRRPVVGFQTRGILGHRPHDSIQDMAAEHIRYMRNRQVRGPYAIAGYSGGAITAFEIACQLEKQGEEVSRLFVLDTYAPGFAEDFVAPIHLTRAQKLWNEWQLLRDRGVLNLFQRVYWFFELHLFSGKRAELLRAAGGPMYRIRKTEEAWREAARAYAGNSFSGEVSLIQTRPPHLRDRLVLERNPSYGWDKVCDANRIERTFVSGDHISMVRDAGAAELAEYIDKAMRRDSGQS